MRRTRWILAALLLAALLGSPMATAAQTYTSINLEIFVYEDRNKDGQFNYNYDPPLTSGVIVRIYALPEETLLVEQVTDRYGYSRPSLPPGRYLIYLDGEGYWESTSPNPVEVSLSGERSWHSVEFGFYAAKPLPLGRWIAAYPGWGIVLGSMLVVLAVLVWFLVRRSRGELSRMETAILIGLGVAALYGFIGGTAVQAGDNSILPSLVLGPALAIQEVSLKIYNPPIAALMGMLFWGLLAGLVCYRTKSPGKVLFASTGAIIIVAVVIFVIILIAFGSFPMR